MTRNITLLFLVGIFVARVCAQSEPPVDPKIILKVSLVNNQREFHVGEIIPLQLSFTSAVKDRYQINMAQYDRSGRMNYERFIVSPAHGFDDPWPDQMCCMGGLTSSMFLSLEPWTLKLNLNDWVRFIQPGEYRLNIVSNRVAIRDPANPLGVSAVSARSNEITLKIVAADTVWQKRAFRDAVTILDQPASPKYDQQYITARRQATETLRFLGTADAAREMAKRMRGDDSHGLDFIYSLGLRSTPERAVARNALEEALADPDHPIDGTFLYTLSRLNSESDATTINWRVNNQRALEKLIAALSTKRGKALSMSLSTAVNEAWNSTELPLETTDKLVSQLIAMFDQLPVNERNGLLTVRWNKVGSAAMLPILKRYAEAYRDFPEMRESNANDLRQLSAIALQRWYELDPEGARPAVIKEISRPRPRFGARVLGILPDETLPELDFILAKNFAATDDYDGSTNLASLIARYATVAIVPQVVEKLDPNIGKLACAIQEASLAYLLRVNPEIARPRLERAIAARGEGATACNRALFQAVAEIHYDPVLETLAIHSLDDPDPQVAANAAMMLGKFGSPAAESALWQRYTSWTAKWAGRESELNRMWADPVDEKVYQLGLGQNLMHALATGKSWLSDKTKLQRLLQMTKVRRLQEQVDPFLTNWQDEALTITIFNASPPPHFSARLAQYEFSTMDTLKQRVAQFPSETKFVLSINPDAPPNSPILIELRAFLAAHAASKNQ